MSSGPLAPPPPPTIHEAERAPGVSGGDCLLPCGRTTGQPGGPAGAVSLAPAAMAARRVDRGRGDRAGPVYPLDPLQQRLGGAGPVPGSAADDCPTYLPRPQRSV